MKPIRPGLCLAGIFVLASFLLPAASALAQGRPSPVEVDPVRLEQLSETISVLGRIVAMREGAVAARVSAPVAETHVQAGDQVEENDVLVRLDPARLEFDRALAESELAAAEAEHRATLSQLDLLRQEHARLEGLKGSAAFSRARLDDKAAEIAATESRAAAAGARVERSRVQLAARSTDLADAEIRAPYRGVIIERRVSAGAYVRVGEPVVMMVDSQNVEIEADIPAERLAGMTGGETMGLEIGATTFKARLRAIIPMENPMTRTRAVRFELLSPSGDEVRAIGQSVTVDLPAGVPREALTVHKDAVTPAQGARIVHVVDKENIVQPRPVMLGNAVGNRFEVLGGLENGEIVVIKGNERLRPGQEVVFAPPAGEPNPAGPDQPEADKTKSDTGS